MRDQGKEARTESGEFRFIMSANVQTDYLTMLCILNFLSPCDRKKRMKKLSSLSQPPFLRHIIAGRRRMPCGWDAKRQKQKKNNFGM